MNELTDAQRDALDHHTGWCSCAAQGILPEPGASARLRAIYDYVFVSDTIPALDRKRLLDFIGPRPAASPVAESGLTWRCASCHDTTAPMGMCERCGVFGTRQDEPGASEGLDVERLARALHETGIRCDQQNTPGSSGTVHHDDAAAIVVALTEGSEP